MENTKKSDVKFDKVNFWEYFFVLLGQIIDIGHRSKNHPSKVD
jgi:hypothetical protein